MFKPSPAHLSRRRLRLTTKQVGGGYYKGNRTGSMGYFGKKKGEYIIDWRKVRTYVCPRQLDKFHLTPFVTKSMEPIKDEYSRAVVDESGEVQPPRTPDGKDFLAKWAVENKGEVLRLWESETGGNEAKEKRNKGKKGKKGKKDFARQK